MLKKILIAGVVGGLAITTGFYAVPAIAQGAIPPPVGRGGGIEKHPIIRKSINQLGRVEQELAKAANDFKGHKEKARDLIRQAIGELKLSIQSDRH
ncbi:MAG: hypothetical protein ACHQ50_03980 [Fimbriimonadales bacterium]